MLASSDTADLAASPLLDKPHLLAVEMDSADEHDTPHLLAVVVERCRVSGILDPCNCCCQD